LRFRDFSRATRSYTLPRPTAQTQALLAAARMLLAAATPEIEGRGLTLIGVAVANLASDAALQLTLPLTERSADQLDLDLDAVRNRLVSPAMTRAVLLGRDPGLTMPHLPD